MTDIKTGLNTNLDLFKGIVRYTDKAGVQHAMETAANLSSIHEVRSALNTIKTNLEAQGFTVNAADVVDVLNDVVGGVANTTNLTGIWRDFDSPLSAAKNLRAFCSYTDADGKKRCVSSPVCSSRLTALAELNKMVADLTGTGLSVLNTCITDDSEFPDTDLAGIFGHAQ